MGGNFGKYESHNMPSAKSVMPQSRPIVPVGFCSRETRRRSFGHRMEPSVVFAKPLLENPFSQKRCFVATLGISADVKQSVWMGGGARLDRRESVFCVSRSRLCEFAWAKIWTNSTLARSLRTVQIAIIISLILISLRSIDDPRREY